jgi:hypothetical protein
MKVQPYVFFDGKCEEALEFYKRAIGAKVNALMRFGEAPDQSQVKPESKSKVMHSAFQIGETEILASDGYCLGGSPSTPPIAPRPCACSPVSPRAARSRCRWRRPSLPPALASRWISSASIGW